MILHKIYFNMSYILYYFLFTTVLTPALGNFFPWGLEDSTYDEILSPENTFEREPKRKIVLPMIIPTEVIDMGNRIQKFKNFKNKMEQLKREEMDNIRNMETSDSELPRFQPVRANVESFRPSDPELIQTVNKTEEDLHREVIIPARSISCPEEKESNPKPLPPFPFIPSPDYQQHSILGVLFPNVKAPFPALPDPRSIKEIGHIKNIESGENCGNCEDCDCSLCEGSDGDCNCEGTNNPENCEACENKDQNCQNCENCELEGMGETGDSDETIDIALRGKRCCCCGCCDCCCCCCCCCSSKSFRK